VEFAITTKWEKEEQGSRKHHKNYESKACASAFMLVGCQIALLCQ